MDKGIMGLLADQGSNRGERSDPGTLLDMAANAVYAQRYDRALALATMSLASSVMKIVDKLDVIASAIDE